MSAAVFLTTLLVMPGVAAQKPVPHIMCVTGVIDGNGVQTVVDMMVVVHAGQDEQVAAAAALKRRGARVPRLGDIPLARQPYVVVGAEWPQFLDKSKLNNFVVQYYNPTGDPTGGKALIPILNAQATWNAVRGSTFRYSYGGQTTLGGAFDRINTISWSPPATNGGEDTLGATDTTFSTDTGQILDSDIQLYGAPGIPWNIDGTDFDVETVMLHEMGHALGLGHSENPNSIMYFTYEGLRRTLDVIDTESIAFLYPPHSTHFAPVPTPSSPFQLIEALGNLAPGGLLFWPTEFEVGDLNNSNETTFAASVGTHFTGITGQGLFVESLARTAQIERTSEIAPGGSEFIAVSGRATINDAGDVGFASVLDQALLPVGTNGGVFLWNSVRQRVTSLVVPGVTAVPGKGVFAGAYGADISSNGTILFSGIVNTTAGISGSLGVGVFGASHNGNIATVAAPGTKAPDGGSFDFAGFPTIGGSGDIGFSGHLLGHPCLTPSSQAMQILCLEGAYVKRHNGGIELIATTGDRAPGGGVFRDAGSPMVNSRGDVVFAGDLTASPYVLRDVGLFFSRHGSQRTVIRPGDAMPGGGHLVTTGSQAPQFSFNDSGEVAFAATLETDNGAGVLDTGVYVWKDHGGLELVARSGTVVPGLGTIAHINSPAYVGSRTPTGGAVLNAAGHVLFAATMSDGLGVLLIAQRVHGPTINIQPTVTDFSPAFSNVGSNPLTLTIGGEGFLANSTVTFNGIAHAASLTSTDDLIITLKAADLKSTGTFPVVVTNPAPGGGASTPLLFTVAATGATDFTGNWGGSFVSSIYGLIVSGALDASFRENGTKLTGMATFPGSTCLMSGAVSGTINGNTSASTIDAGSGQTISLNATLNASASGITGTYVLHGDGCVPGGDFGTFTLARLP